MLSLTLIVVGAVVVQRYLRRVERSPGDPADKMHRMRVWGLAEVFVSFIVLLAGNFEVNAEAAATGLGRSTRIGGLVVLAVAWLVAMMAVTVTVARGYQRLRGTQERPSRLVRRALRMYAAMMLLPLTWWVLYPLVVRRHAGPAPMVVLALGLLVVSAVVGPYVVMLMVRSRRPDEPTRRRLLAICRRHGVRLRDVRIIDTGADRTANALSTGVLPGLRYIFVTDRLLTDFADDELEAVLAHEIGHARQHHLLVKLGLVVVATGGVVGLLVLTASLLPDARPVRLIAAVLLPLAMLAPCSALERGWAGVAC